MLAVKMLAAKTAWLDARPQWQDGRVVWGAPDRAVAAGPAELSSAQRAINQMARYPVVVARVFGDAEAFVRGRRERLRLAKRMAGVFEPDLEGLARDARRGVCSAVRRLAEALVAEALCVDGLPTSPSAALLACGPSAAAALTAVLEGEDAPDEARALAALVLGAGEHPDAAACPRDPLCRQAHAFGRAFGLPTEPVLAVRLLAAADGTALALRCASLLTSEGRFHLAPDLLRRLLEEGAAPTTVVELAEACAAASPLEARILERRSALPDPATQECRKSAAAILSAEREEALAAVVARVRDYAATSDPDAVRAAVRLVAAMLDLGPFAVPLARAAAAALGEGLDLPPELRLDFLRTLVDCRDLVWTLATLPHGKDPRKAPRRFQNWLEERHRCGVRPLRSLLEHSRDAGIVAEALELRALAELSGQTWSDAGMYRFALELCRLWNPRSANYRTDRICDALGRYATAKDARADIQPVLRAARGAHGEPAMSAVLALLEWRSRSTQRVPLRRFAPYVPRLVAYLAGVENYYRAFYFVRAIAEIERSAPEGGEAWFDSVVRVVTEIEREDEDAVDDGLIAPGAALAAALDGGGTAKFEEVFETLMRRVPRGHSGWLRAGATAVAAHRALRAALAGAVVAQPQRAVALLVRVGLAAGLDAGALAPLAALQDPHAADAGAPAEWDALLERFPDLAGEARGFAHARRLLGEGDGVPPAVRRALGLPEKLAAELRFLEARLETSPDEHLAIRAGNLRLRLGDEESLLRAVEKDVRERLARAAAEAKMAAAEHQVVECFRAKLAALVGAPPPDVRFDDDLLNAIVLSTSVTVNRKLLLALIRAHVWGDAEWVERQPANAVFLDGLAARGVDVAAWLAAFPRVYPCAGIPGGRVRLAAERSPLRVLQMGNYFGTCLSVGDINAFSTIANACELNKRVIYATDGEGRVVGRKLVAVNDAGALVGFFTYVNTHDDAANTAIRAAFAGYVAELAASCGIPLGGGGTVPLLFAEEWYDDGAVEWSDETPSPDGEPTSRRSPYRPSSSRPTPFAERLPRKSVPSCSTTLVTGA